VTDTPVHTQSPATVAYRVTGTPVQTHHQLLLPPVCRISHSGSWPTPNIKATACSLPYVLYQHWMLYQVRRI